MTVIKASTKLREHSDDSWLLSFTELDNKFTQFFKIDSLSIRNFFSSNGQLCGCGNKFEILINLIDSNRDCCIYYTSLMVS